MGLIHGDNRSSFLYFLTYFIGITPSYFLIDGWGLPRRYNGTGNNSQAAIFSDVAETRGGLATLDVVG